MSISIYRLTVPMFQRGLASLKTYLDKAEAYAREKNIDPAILVSARLAPDMLPLSGQYQRASDSAKFALARLTAARRSEPAAAAARAEVPEGGILRLNL